MPDADALALTVAVRRYRDGSRIEEADVPGQFVAVSPRGRRLRCSETRLVALRPTIDEAEADLRELGYGPESGGSDV